MAEYGPSPFSDYEEYKKFRRVTKKDTAARWDPANGWRSNAKKPMMKKQVSLSGNEYLVPDNDIAEYETYYNTMMGNELSDTYKNNKGRLKATQTPADYIDYAFGKGTKAKIIEQEGCGHIKYLWYSERYQLLKVEFVNNGSVVVFFRVPMQLAGTLIGLAKSGTTELNKKGEVRHLLGIYFWDLVRIRGTVHGSRYKFIYEKNNNTGNLPGRPFGSGKYYYETETGPNKNIAAAKKAVEEFRDELIARKHMLENIESNLDAKHVLATDTGESVKSLIADTNDAIKLAEERLSEIGEVPEVTRSIRTERIAEPRNIDNPANVPFTGNLAAFNNLSSAQQRELEQATTGKDAEFDIQKKGISRHNALRRIDRTWDIDRLDDFVETLAREGRLPGGTVNAFYKHFTNAGDQFDYLRMRGLIPQNAIYKE